MKEKLLSWLRCPECGGRLNIETSTWEDGEIKDGLLTSECGRKYPVAAFVPRMMPAYVCPEFMGKYGQSTSPTERGELDRREVRTRTGFDIEWRRSRRFFLDLCTYDNTDLFCRAGGMSPEQAQCYYPGNLVLDAGCGTGRYSIEALKLDAEVIALDFTESGVRVAQEAARTFAGAHVIQADILKLPLMGDLVDEVFCVGVVHHTRDPRQAFSELTRVLKPEEGWY